MPASCYTVRPGPESGWLTFFELSPDRRCQGFFLVLGPVTVSPESRRMAQGMARQIVAGYKRLLDPDPAGCLAEAREVLLREQPHLEFGVLVLSGDRAFGTRVGRVQLVPLTAGARRRIEREPTPPGEPFSLSVTNGDRFFFGRVPLVAAGGVPSAEAVQGLEQGGGGDGALILSVHSLRGAAGLEDGPGERGAPREHTGGERAASADEETASPVSRSARKAGRGRAVGWVLGVLLAAAAAAGWLLMHRS